MVQLTPLPSNINSLPQYDQEAYWSLVSSYEPGPTSTVRELSVVLFLHYGFFRPPPLMPSHPPVTGLWSEVCYRTEFFVLQFVNIFIFLLLSLSLFLFFRISVLIIIFHSFFYPPLLAPPSTRYSFFVRGMLPYGICVPQYDHIIICIFFSPSHCLSLSGFNYLIPRFLSSSDRSVSGLWSQVLSVPKLTENLYCICLSIPKIYT